MRQTGSGQIVATGVQLERRAGQSFQTGMDLKPQQLSCSD